MQNTNLWILHNSPRVARAWTFQPSQPPRSLIDASCPASPPLPILLSSPHTNNRRSRSHYAIVLATTTSPARTDGPALDHIAAFAPHVALRIAHKRTCARSLRSLALTLTVHLISFVGLDYQPCTRAARAWRSRVGRRLRRARALRLARPAVDLGAYSTRSMFGVLQPLHA